MTELRTFQTLSQFPATGGFGPEPNLRADLREGYAIEGHPEVIPFELDQGADAFWSSDENSLI